MAYRPKHGRRSSPARPLLSVAAGLAGVGLVLAAVLPAPADDVPAPPVPAVEQSTRPDPGSPVQASRSRALPAVLPVPAAVLPVPAAAAPSPEPVPVLPGCTGTRPDLTPLRNGRLPEAVLCRLPGDSGEALRADAAVAFVALADAYAAAFGRPICVLDGYRTLAEQQTLRRTKRRYAAPPGTSEHGWGVAVDLGCGVQSSSSPQHRWLRDNAGQFGWHLPAWAMPGGARPEPWHWEYAGG